jgi:hypothetical protein
MSTKPSILGRATPSPARGLAVLTALLGLAVAGEASAITFGEYDGDEHPEVGGLMVEFAAGYGWPNCSGALVHVDEEEGYGLFLTAGHCTLSLEDYVAEGRIADFGVNFAEVPDFWDPIQYPATAVYTNYDPETYSFHSDDGVDWGLIRFEFDDASALPEPARLADPDFLDGFSQRELHDGTFTVVGYGATVDRMGGGYYYEDRRQHASPQYLNLIGNSVKMNQVGPAGNSGGCYADSGGPLYWVDDDGSEILVGVTRGGHSRCYAYGYFNRVDSEDALDFVAGGME